VSHQQSKPVAVIRAFRNPENPPASAVEKVAA
jgi:hypothetical protein